MPSAAGFFGAFAPEATNITGSQQEMYQRSLDRQQQLERAMQNAMENRRLEAMIQQENARAALDKRRLALEEQQVAQGGVAQPRGNPVYNYQKGAWEQEMWNPLNGQITVQTVPGHAGDPTGVEETKARFKAITGQDWTPETKLTPELKDQLEIFGWKFPNTRPTEAQKYAEYQTMFSEMHPEWGVDEVNRQSMIATNRYFAAEQGVRLANPRAAGEEGLSAADQRALKDEISGLDKQIAEAYIDARTWAKSASTKQSLADQTWMQDFQKAQEAQQTIKDLQKQRQDIIDGYLKRSQQPRTPSLSPQPGSSPTAQPQGGTPADIPQPIRSPLLQGAGDTGQVSQADIDRWAQAGIMYHPGTAAQEGAETPLRLPSPTPSPAGTPPNYGVGLTPPEVLPRAGWDQPPTAAAPPAGQQPGLGQKWSVSQWQLNNRNPNIKVWEAAREAARQGYQVVP